MNTKLFCQKVEVISVMNLNKKIKPCRNKILQLVAKAHLMLLPPRSPGNYELRISIPGATGYVSKKFYSYGSWGRTIILLK